MRNIFLLLISAISITAGAQITFEKLFGDSHRTVLNDIAEKPQGGYFVCGSDCNSFPCLGYVASLDSLGNMLWQNYFFTPDSDFTIADVIALDSNTFVLQCDANKPAGWYAVPRLLTMDSTGMITDTFMVDISGVYNSTVNMGLLPGANKSFWTLTFIGTYGISNKITVVRQNQNLDTLKTLAYGAFYYSQFHTNNNGQLVVRTEMDNWDSIQGVYYEDLIRIYDTSGISLFSGGYDSLPLSDEFLLRNDGGFNTFRNNSPSLDTLFLNHFDNNGNLIFEKEYPLICNGIVHPVLAADSGYFLILTEHDTVFYNIINAQLCKFNSVDDTLWTINVARNYFQSIRQIEPTSDGGCIILFHTDGPGDSLNYLMKIGPHGEHTFQTSVSEVNKNFVTLFPNPTLNTFTIKNISANEKILAEIINMMGDVLHKENLHGKSEYTIDAKLAKGIYFVRLSEGTKCIVRKLVVE